MSPKLPENFNGLETPMFTSVADFQKYHMDQWMAEAPHVHFYCVGSVDGSAQLWVIKGVTEEQHAKESANEFGEQCRKIIRDKLATDPKRN